MNCESHIVSDEDIGIAAPAAAATGGTPLDLRRRRLCFFPPLDLEAPIDAAGEKSPEEKDGKLCL